MTGPRIGSLFSGYGGLELGIQAAIGGSVEWVADNGRGPSKILAHHWPDTPNLGDLAAVDWAAVPPVDILAGGFPCQDVSVAGRRAGIHGGTRSGLWAEFARAIDALNPGMVVIENVRGLLSAAAAGAVESDPWGLGNGEPRPSINAFGVILGDLADSGYDARWRGVRAADAGAPHSRFRIFVIAHRRDSRGRKDNPPRGLMVREGGISRGAEGTGSSGSDRTPPALPSGIGYGQQIGEPSTEKAGAAGGHVPADSRGGGPVTDWGAYSAAIARWEIRTGHPAPAPLHGGRLSPAFVEWMMGLHPGHVTHPDIGLSRTAQLTALGNGVVPQQAQLALQLLLS